MQQFNNHDKASSQNGELFQLILDNVQDYAIFMTDPNGRIESWNPGVQRLLGYAEAEIVGQPIHIIFTAEDRAAGAHLKELHTARTRGRAEDNRWHQRKDGSRFWANGLIMPLKNADDTLRGFAKIMRDDTASKLAQDRLAESNRRISNVFESITDALMTLDREWRFTDLNHNFEIIAKRSRQELIGKSFWSEFPAVIGSAFETNYRRAAQQQIPVRFEEYYQPLDLWVEVRAFPSPDGLSVYFQDITERKRAEAAVRESEEQFRLFVAASSDTLYKMNRDWSEMRNLDGMQFLADTNAPSGVWLENYIPADEQPRVLTAIQAAIENKAVFELEHQVVRADNSIGWMFSRAVPILDQQSGEILEWFGAASDITARKQAEHERERLLRDLEVEARASPAFSSKLRRSPPCCAARITFSSWRIRRICSLSDTAT